MNHIAIPNSVTSLGSYAFYSCYSLKEITIPGDVTSVSADIFYYCYSLTEITIPSDVTTVNTDAFYRCSTLTIYDFTRVSEVPTLSNVSAFSNINKTAKIIVPDDLYNDWIATSKWSDFADYIVKESDYV